MCCLSFAADATSLVNPILTQLQHALDTTEMEFEPLYDVEFKDFHHDTHDEKRILTLTCRVIPNVYADTIKR